MSKKAKKSYFRSIAKDKEGIPEKIENNVSKEESQILIVKIKLIFICSRQRKLYAKAGLLLKDQ